MRTLIEFVGGWAAVIGAVSGVALGWWLVRKITESVKRIYGVDL